MPRSRTSPAPPEYPRARSPTRSTGSPGVSEATRARILGVAEQFGWHPSSAASALSDGRAGVLGLIVDRPARTHPQLSAVSRDIVAFGAHAADRLLRVVAGEEVTTFQDTTPVFIPRGSTGPPA